MNAWWQSLSGQEAFFWALAIFSSVLFCIQAIITFLGLNAGGEADADTSMPESVTAHDPTEVLADFSDRDFWSYFSFRNLVAFFLGFSWTGITCLDADWSLAAAILLGVAVGLIFVAIVMAIMNAISRLQDAGNIDLREAAGKEASVTIAIPAGRAGRGKVRFTLQGRLAELEAETEGEHLNKNERVFVIRQIDGHTLLVGKQS